MPLASSSRNRSKLGNTEHPVIDQEKRRNEKPDGGTSNAPRPNVDAIQVNQRGISDQVGYAFRNWHLRLSLQAASG